MKTAAVFIALTMITAGCAEKERHPERYLDSINLAVHIDRPAEVSGVLRQGVSPAQTLEYPDLTGASRISFECSREDSLRMAELLETSGIPFNLSAMEEGALPRVRFWQEGITWRPAYSWTMEGDSCRFAARVVLSNSTGREWFSRNTVMKDMLGEPVCMVPDTLLIRNGDMELGWWSARGRVLPLTLLYGWPQHSIWNQLVPCVTPGAGVLTGTAWPRRTGDTLWIQPADPLEITEHVTPVSSGYECTLIIHNQTGDYVEARIAHPDRTPRGAVFQPGEEFPYFLPLRPGDLALLEYVIRYQ